jgi:glycosyltransferase involved in cell wall biosynthesis
MAPDLSIVLPCYRAARLAGESVRRLHAFMETTGIDWELIVVDDGGGDFPSGDDAVGGVASLIRLERNRGKGAAVSAGMTAARGRVRVYTDVDLPYDLSLIPVIVSLVLDRHFHLVVGDRTLPDSSYRAELSLGRRLASGVFTQIVGTLVTGGFFDTQCGLKGMRGDVADELFRLRRIDRFAFDVELVYLALHHGLDIKRIPVQLRANATSSVRLFRDSARGMIDVLSIKYHQLLGHYASSRLASMVCAEFGELKRASQVEGASTA